jgi:starch phosphorylase
MVTEYLTQLYDPAHAASIRLRQNKYARARELAGWTANVHKVWDHVSFAETGPGPDGAVLNGKPICLRAVVNLAGLEPNDVRVEAVVGRVGANGQLEETEVITLPSVEQRESLHVFAREYVPQQTGRLGYALRVSPNHCDDPLTRPCNALLKWGTP